MTKRPGTQSDEDRAAAELQRRRTATPAAGVPIHTPHPADFTPVTDVLPLAAGDESTRILLTRIWQHTANMEMRLMAQISATTGEAHRQALDEHEATDHAHHEKVSEALADIHGRSGQNGKLGELRRRVDALSRAAWLVVSVAVGGLGAAAIKLVMVVRAFDAVEARSMHSAQQLIEMSGRVLRLETAAITRRYRPAPEPERTPDP